MTSRIEPHRVSAYNTSKHSENKMHDDTVAKRYGFIGGLVPGVDVMAYMMHLPVAKWGRAFLERGLMALDAPDFYLAVSGGVNAQGHLLIVHGVKSRVSHYVRVAPV